MAVLLDNVNFAILGNDPSGVQPFPQHIEYFSLRKNHQQTVKTLHKILVVLLEDMHSHGCIKQCLPTKAGD